MPASKFSNSTTSHGSSLSLVESEAPYNLKGSNSKERGTEEYCNLQQNNLKERDKRFVCTPRCKSITRHRYYTRSSAKLGLVPSETSLASENSTLDDFILPLDDNDSQFLLDDTELEHKALFCSKISFFPPIKMRSGRCRSPVDMDFPMTCQPSGYTKYYRVILLLIAIGLLGMTVAYVNDRYTESYSSFKQVKRELGNIKSQMEQMKENVQCVVNSKEEMEKKLDQINEILIDIKKSQYPADAKCPKKSPTRLRKAIKEVLDKYDADKTGRTDYALASAGGKIISIRNTATYPTSSVKLMGVTLCTTTKEPSLMIMPGTNPGECWAFQGPTGSAVIELISMIYVTGVTLEHIPKSLSPTGNIKSAPKDFSITGLSCIGEKEGTLLGKFTYDENGPPLQYFPIDGCSVAYKMIEFKVHTNHGSADFTCVYRLRVHGELLTGSRGKENSIR